MSERLTTYLASRNAPAEFQAVTADASTREYFRIQWKGRTAIACVFPEPFTAAANSYEDVTRLFLAGGLPVADLFDIDSHLGVIIQEDLGDVILRERLQNARETDCELLVDNAIALIARIQAATPLAFERRSLASRLKFDTQKLSWELDYFKTHYFTTYKNEPLSPAEDAALTHEFIELSAELERRSAVLCHRDYHAANLMIDAAGQLRIIDHQDARIGSPAYDIVSLLLDRVTDPPDEGYLAEKRRLLISERWKLGLSELNESEFEHEFNLQTIQRCLKAAGTFSYQSAVRGKDYFVPYIEPMLRISTDAAEKLGRFPVIQSIIGAAAS
jgi:aminoglycoside/choline kinase family phosphotransferase